MRLNANKSGSAYNLDGMNYSFVEGFWDGLGAGLFTRLRRPGAPDELIDSRSYEEFLDNDFAQRCDLPFADLATFRFVGRSQTSANKGVDDA